MQVLSRSALLMMQARGVEFVDGVGDQSYGLVSHFKMADDLMV